VTPNIGPSKKPLFQPKGGMPMKVSMASASKPAMFGSGSKPPGAGGLFKKPMMGGRKKF